MTFIKFVGGKNKSASTVFIDMECGTGKWQLNEVKELDPVTVYRLQTIWGASKILVDVESNEKQQPEPRNKMMEGAARNKDAPNGTKRKRSDNSGEGEKLA